MAADPLQHVKPGDPLSEVVTADVMNALKDGVRRVNKGRLPPPSGGRASNQIHPSLTVLVRNDSGADASAGYILAISSKIGDPVNEPISYQRRPVVLGDVPAASTDLIVILSEPILDGEIGRGVLMGIAVCDIEINDAGHEWAVPIAADATKLESATSGPVRIEWKESSGATRRAIVLLGDGASAGSGSFTLAGRTGSQTINNGDTLTLNNGVVSATDTWTPDVASASLAGIVSTGTQTFAGEKSFKDQVRINTALDHGYPNLTVYSNGVDSISTLIGDGIRIAENGSAIGGADEWMDLYFASATKFELNLQNASGPSTSTLLSIYRGDAFYGYAFQFTSSTGTADLWVGGNKGATGTSGGGDTVTSGLITTLGTPITTEVIQDAVGSILVSSSRISATYDDGVPSITHDLILDTITADYLHATQTEILFGRSTAGAGGGEEITMGTSMAIVGGVLDVDVVDGGTF